MQNFIANNHANFVEDQDLNPVVYAEQFSDPNATIPQSPEELLRRARMILSTELGKDPLLRHAMRELFKKEAVVSVLPTDRGVSKIDEYHHYFVRKPLFYGHHSVRLTTLLQNFKYLHNKSVTEMLESSQFLKILAAETELLVTLTISLPIEAKARFERTLNEAFASESYSDTAKAWNEERSRVVQEALEQHLIPVGAKWTREWIREEVEDYLADRCGGILKEVSMTTIPVLSINNLNFYCQRIDVAPYARPEMQPGDVASVLAISWGKGDPQKDAITLVFVDEASRLREHTKIDNLVDQELRDEFVDLLKRRRPDVIVIGGFSIATAKLVQRVKEIIRGNQQEGANEGWGNDGRGNENGTIKNEQAFDIPVIYVHDEVARIYQHSKRAAAEYSALSPTGKYCIGLARYTQSPMIEYAALGHDITAISFDEEDQHLVSI